MSRDECLPDERHEVPSNCQSVWCPEGYLVEFEADASKEDDGYRVWFSLYDGEKICSSSSIVVYSLDQFTLRAVAIGYAQGWDEG